MMNRVKFHTLCFNVTFALDLIAAIVYLALGQYFLVSKIIIWLRLAVESSIVYRIMISGDSLESKLSKLNTCHVMHIFSITCLFLVTVVDISIESDASFKEWLFLNIYNTCSAIIVWILCSFIISNIESEILTNSMHNMSILVTGSVDQNDQPPSYDSARNYPLLQFGTISKEHPPPSYEDLFNKC